MIRETFGQFIARIRNERRIPADRIYARLCITAPYLYAVEHGYSAPFDEERMDQLAEVLALTPAEEKRMRLLALQDIAIRNVSLSPEHVIQTLFPQSSAC